MNTNHSNDSLSNNVIRDNSKKNVWIINQYGGSKIHGMVFRSYYIAKELVKNNFDISFFSGSYSHLFRILPEITGEFTPEEIDGIKYIWVKLKKYKDSRGFQRFYSMIEFMLKLFKFKPSNDNIPSYIIISSPSLFSFINAYYFSRKYNAKLIFEVRDLWPLTLMELGNFSRYNPLIFVMRYIEKFAYRKSDGVVSVLPGTLNYMVNSGLDADKFYYIPNGIDLEEMSQVAPLSETVLCQLPINKFIIGHIGTMGASHSLECFIDAANILHNNENYHFVLVGDGPEKQNLMQRSEYNNVTFIDSIEKKQVQTMLNLFDLCYVGCPNEDIYKYGISANKVFDYMYAAKPIILSGNVACDPIMQASCGITVQPEDPYSIIDGIDMIFQKSSEQRIILGNNGRQFVLQNHTYQELARNYISMLATIQKEMST